MNRIVLPLTGVYSENNHVLGHELAHAFHYDIMKSSNAGITGGNQIPLWFIEGMSEYLTIGTFAPLTSMWMRDAVLFDDIPSIEMMGKNPSYFPYRYGHALWAFIAGNFGDDIIIPLFESVLQNGWYQGFKLTLGTPVDSLSIDWEFAVTQHFRYLVQNKKKPAETGNQIIDNTSINLAPVLSPDGKLIAYFSSKDLFSIDLFIADAANGKIKNKLINTQTDEHFEALRFTNSSAAWSPDADKIALPVFKTGDNAIAIYNVKKGRVEQTLHFKELGDISSIAWSPDGKSFCSQQNTICDLLSITSSKTLQKLTDDVYAELQPSWALMVIRSCLLLIRLTTPVGFSSYGPPRIALFNLTDSTRYLSIANPNT